MTLSSARGCHKSYHPECVGKDSTLLETDEQWICGKSFITSLIFHLWSFLQIVFSLSAICDKLSHRLIGCCVQCWAFNSVLHVGKKDSSLQACYVESVYSLFQWKTHYKNEWNCPLQLSTSSLICYNVSIGQRKFKGISMNDFCDR